MNGFKNDNLNSFFYSKLIKRMEYSKTAIMDQKQDFLFK